MIYFVWIINSSKVASRSLHNCITEWYLSPASNLRHPYNINHVYWGTINMRPTKKRYLARFLSGIKLDISLRARPVEWLKD